MCVVSAGEAHICERKTDYAFEVSAQHLFIYSLWNIVSPLIV